MRWSYGPSALAARNMHMEVRVIPTKGNKDSTNYINKSGITQKRHKMELWFLRTALRLIATKTHIEFRVMF